MMPRNEGGLIHLKILWMYQPSLLVALLCLAPRSLGKFAAIYAWLRVADDIVDAPLRNQAAVQTYIRDAREFLHTGHRAADPPGLVAPPRATRDKLDQILLKSWDPALKAVVGEMTEAVAWDAFRAPRVTEAELQAQCARIGRAYVRGIWHCIAGEPAPRLAEELGAAATVIHQLRDREEDEGLGYINLPAALGQPDLRRPEVRDWWLRRTEAAIHLLETSMLQGSWRARILIHALCTRYARKGRRLSADLRAAASGSR
ncbi:MAG TPA: squalene/phytoene synthase family protein, partial [Myxococcota bacterium]|nr:squalene/phytoene synthase family protein [Myxococcota bacterium]